MAVNFKIPETKRRYVCKARARKLRRAGRFVCRDDHGYYWNMGPRIRILPILYPLGFHVHSDQPVEVTCPICAHLDEVKARNNIQQNKFEQEENSNEST